MNVCKRLGKNHRLRCWPRGMPNPNQFIKPLISQKKFITQALNHTIAPCDEIHPVTQTRPRGCKAWVHSQTHNKVQWLAACGHVAASSQSLHFILSLKMCSSFITSRPGIPRDMLTTSNSWKNLISWKTFRSLPFKPYVLLVLMIRHTAWRRPVILWRHVLPIQLIKGLIPQTLLRSLSLKQHI